MTAQALALPLNLYPERGLSAYIKTVNTQPMPRPRKSASSRAVIASTTT